MHNIISIKVINSEIIKLIHTPFNPNVFDNIINTIGKQIILLNAHIIFEYLGFSIA